MAGFHDRGSGPFDVRMVPHPAITLVVEFGDGPLTVDDAAGRRQRGNLVAGLAPGAVRASGKNTDCVQVRMSPVVAHAVLGVSPMELEHAVVGLDALWGRDAPRIREQLNDARSWEERFALMDASLARRCETARPVDPEVAWAWDRTVASRGWIRIDELAAEIGWSRKRLWSRFRSQIGLPPKRAAKLVRFDHAVHRLAAGERAAHVAARLRRPVSSPSGGCGVRRRHSGDDDRGPVVGGGRHRVDRSRRRACAASRLMFAQRTRGS
ncbi:helix-turn-helix domain-containing protein [Actinomadura sp. 6N118]|uniref:helix-turn-helix domain-containing protein n=1 Tax=Actinomadura sp. 6N118 TaxID=3375151 RepID=UPI0037B8093E